jgi:hypothetical protein
MIHIRNPSEYRTKKFIFVLEQAGAGNAQAGDCGGRYAREKRRGHRASPGITVIWP